jgi:hypothetical protein
MRNLLKASMVIVLLSGCMAKEDQEVKQQASYFDLKGYFSTTAQQLQKRNPTVDKSVAKNELTETKKLKMENWNQELALFMEADINKPAWKDSYTKDSSATKITYISKDPDLKTQKIEIYFEKGLPVKFSIHTSVTNLLYDTEEHLEFYSDSAYLINKHQKVVLLGENNYLIKGKFQ